MFKHCVIVFFVSMVPLIELRGAIPYGVAFGLPLWLTYLIAIAGNMLPVPIIYFFARKVLVWGKDKRYIGKFFTFCLEKGEKAGRKLQAKAGRGLYWALLLFVGILGLAANIISIFILASQREDNMNMKAAFLEVMNDALGSVAVVASALVMIPTGWNGFDAVAGAVIALMMIPRAIKLLHNAVKVLLEETPDGLDLDKVREHLEDVPHVLAVHDLHASTVSTGMPILMAHVVVDKDLTMEEAATILTQLQDCLREHFPVSVPHTTFQLEPEGYSSPSSNELHE